MKKKTRTARKVLSVFLSVLMILTTLTVAVPGIALAADSYYVRVYLNIYDGANSDGYEYPYTVVTDPSSEFYGKPDDYKWDYGSSWNAFDNSKGYDGEVNMAGFTLFYDNNKKFETYDLAADLINATTILGNNWTSMDELTLANFADCTNKVEKVYGFELDAFPSSLFWINDENNAVNGETSFGIYKITIAESSTSQEHTLWTGLSGSESYYECYYGTITPTGLITPWDDCPGEDAKSFYKDYTTSAVGTWIDPFNVGDYNTYPVNNYLSGGVSASFTVGNSGSQTNIDFVDVGNTNNYYINFTNHSTQDATFTLFKAENKSLLSGYYDNYPVPSGKTVSFLLNKSSMGGDGGYVDFSFKFKLDNVYNSDGTTQTDFYQAAAIGTWNTTDDSSEVGLPAGESSNKGFTLYNNADIDVMNQFASDVGIFETVSTTGNRTANATFEYNYWLENSNNRYTDWSQIGLRLYTERWRYSIINDYRLHLQSSGTTGTINLTGNIANTGTASISMTDLVQSYTSASDSFTIPDKSDRPWAYYNTPCTPYWQGVTEHKWGTLYYQDTPGIFRFCGEMFKGSAASTAPGKIVFNNMTWVCPGNTTRYVYFSGTINVYVFDKTDLRNYVRNLGGLGVNWAPMRTRFNDAQWNAYENALSTAVRVLANQKTNQKAVTDAYNNLYSATEALKATASLKSQVAEVTYTQRATDYTSNAVATTKKYIIMPIGTETAVPAYDTYKYATSGNVVGKQSSNLKTNYTQYDTGINPIDYRYWKVDFTGVEEAKESATALLNTSLEAYSDEYYEQLFNARETLALLDDDADTWTPTHQADIDNALAALNGLLTHTENDDSCTFEVIESVPADCTNRGYEIHECSVCGKEKTVYTTDGPADHEDTDNDHICDICGNEISECADSDSDHNCDTCGDKLTDCADNNNDHDCDICGDKVSECADADNDHNCDTCGDKLTDCADNNNDHNCDTCGDKLTECADNNNDHNCDTCGDKVSECADADNDHNCDTCGDKLTDCADNNNDHNCDTCGDKVSECADADNDHNCDTCGDKLTDCADNNNDHNCDTCGDKLTECADNNNDHDCDICGTTLSNCTDADSDKDHACDICGKEDVTTHEYVNPVLARPTYNEETGKWENGTYTSTCNCGETETTPAIRAIYTAYDEAVAGLNALLAGTTLTDSAKAEINKVLTDNKIADNLVTAEQSEVDKAANALKVVLDKINGDTTGAYERPDFGAYDAQVKIYNEDTSTVVSDEDAQAAADAMATVDAIKANTNATAKDNDATIETQVAIIKAINDKYAVCVDGTHDYETKVTAPTCTEQGYTTYTCKICGNGYSSDYISANGHTWSSEGTFTADTSVAPYAGYYTYKCTVENCNGELKIEVEPADYSELDSIVEALEKLIEDNDLTEAVKAEIQAAVDEAEELPDDLTKAATEDGVTTPDGQKIIKDLIDELKDIKTEIENGINDETAIKPDTNAAEEAVEGAEALEEKIELPEDVKTRIDELRTELDEIFKNIEEDDNATAAEYQDDLDAVEEAAKEIIDKYADCADGHTWNAGNLTKRPELVDGEWADGYYTYTCEKCDATKTVPAVRADYAAYDKAVADLNALLADATLTEAAKTEIANVLTNNVIDNNLVTAEQSEVDKAANALKVVLDKIANDETGAYEKVDYTDYNTAVNAYDDLKDTMSDDDKAAVEAIKAEIDAIPDDGSKAQYQEQVNDAADAINTINSKYADCADGNHIWGKEELTKAPTADEQGEYTEKCTICGETQITKVDLADYSEFNTAVEALKELAKTEDLTDTAAKAIAEALNKAEELDKNLPADVTTVDGKEIKGGQDEIDALVAVLEKVVADTNAAITDGSALKPDYEAWETAEGTYDSLDKTNVKAEIAKEANDLKAEIAEKQENTSHTQATATQDDIDKATARLNEIIAGIEAGTYKNPDYSGAEEAIQDAKDVADSENIPDDKEAEIEAEIEELEKELEEIKKANPDSNNEEAKEQIAEIEQKARDIIDTYADCANGNHDYADATCTAPQTCNVCGATTGKENGHTWKTEGIFTADTSVEGFAGYYTYGCEKCEATTVIYVEPANYSELNSIVEELKEIIDKNPDLTDAAKKDIQDAIDKAEALDGNLTKEATDETTGITTPDGQGEIDALVAKLKDVKTDAENDIADGSALKPDYTAWDAAEGTYDALDKTNASESLVNEATNLKNTINALKTDPTANVEDQPTVDEATARLNAIITEINASLAEKPDFDGYDNSHDTYEELVKTYGDKIKDSVATEVAGLDAVVEAVRSDETATKLEDQSTIDNAKTALDAIITGIIDGTLLDPDYSKVEEKLEEVNEVDGLTEEAQDKIDAIEETLQEIKDKQNPEANYKDDQKFVDILEGQLDEILDAIEDGSALVPDYEAWEDAEGTYDALDKTLVKDEIIAEANALKDKIAKLEANDTLTQATATQDDIDDATKRLNEIIDGIEDGTYIKPADFTEVDNDLADAKEKADNNDVVNGVKDDIKEIEDKLDELRETATAENQGEIDALEDELEEIITGIENGTLVKPDYEAWEEAEGAYDNLDTTNVKEEIIDEAEALKAEIAGKQADDTLTKATATQDDIDNATKRLNEIITGIENGTLKKPADYTEVDKDLADAKDKAENNDVIDGVKEDIKEIEDKLNELRNDPTTNIEDQDEIDALEKELEDIIAGIEDGSLVKPDYTDADEAIKDAEGDIDNGGKLSDEDKVALDELKEKLDEIKNDPTSNVKYDQGAVDGIKDKVQDIVDKYNACANGNHTYKTSETAPTCTEDGYKLHVCELCSKSYKEAGEKAKGHAELILEAKDPTCSEVGYTEGKYCGVCGEILVAQQEIAKLPHTDADDDGVCDHCHNSGLYDGCVCLCHNDHWFWHLVYLIIRIIWRVFKIHPVCACGRIHF